MKKINLILFGFMLLLVGTGCEKDRTFVEFADLETGAYARELSREGNFFLTDIANSTITASVEFYDVNQGQDVASYSWTVNYIDKTNGGADNAGPANVLTIDASSFGTSPDGLPSADMTFTLQGALDALGLTADDVTGGSTMRYNATVTMKDGRTFTAANTGNNIVSSAAFRALFAFDANLLCTSTLAGDINYVTTNAVTGPAGTACTATEITGTVTLTETDAGRYEISDASFGLFRECWADDPATGISLVDACNKVSTDGADQYADSYTYTILDVTGPSMTIEWVNTYGDGATSVLTRADGADWPALSN